MVRTLDLTPWAGRWVALDAADHTCCDAPTLAELLNILPTAGLGDVRPAAPTGTWRPGRTVGRTVRATLAGMATVADRRAERIAFLLAVYEQVDGSERGKANRDEIGARIGLGQDRTIDAFQWCNGLGYLARTDMGGGLGLSQRGIAEAE